MRRRWFIPTSAASYAILVLLALFFVLPFLWLIVASFTPNANLGTVWFANAGLDNFRYIFDSGYGKGFENSLVLGVSTMVLVVVLSCGAGYTLSRYQFRFKQTVMLLILFCTGLPVLALIFPLYAMYVQLGLIDSTPGVIIFFVASLLPFNTWLMKNFLDSVSVDLEEAAWVDGCSTFGSFWRIVLPLSAPGIAVVGILSFIGAYTNFFVPFILYSSPEKFPASVQLFSFFGSYGQINYGQIAAYAMLYTLPAVALYMFVSRFFVKGINIGGSKG
ncbi:MAG TPA: carbohydrate ABC transporter permease [Chloroflexota bacterium]|jgi:multiple sugar transport system permease protein